MVAKYNRWLGLKFWVEIWVAVKNHKGELILSRNKEAKVKILSRNEEQDQKLQGY